MKPVVPKVAPGLRVRITCPGALNIRSTPSKSGKFVGSALAEAEYQVYEVKDLTDVWVRISEKEQKWIALYHRGSTNAVFFTVRGDIDNL
jgi:hypothetical protein